MARKRVNPKPAPGNYVGQYIDKETAELFHRQVRIWQVDDPDLTVALALSRVIQAGLKALKNN